MMMDLFKNIKESLKFSFFRRLRPIFTAGCINFQLDVKFFDIFSSIARNNLIQDRKI